MLLHLLQFIARLSQIRMLKIWLRCLIIMIMMIEHDDQVNDDDHHDQSWWSSMMIMMINWLRCALPNPTLRIQIQKTTRWKIWMSFFVNRIFQIWFLGFIGWGPGGHKDQNEPLRNQIQNEYFLALPDGPGNFCQGIPPKNLCFDFFHTTCTKLSNSYTRFSTEKNESAKSLISIGFYRVCCMRTFMPLEVDISRNGRIPTFWGNLKFLRIQYFILDL